MSFIDMAKCYLGGGFTANQRSKNGAEWVELVSKSDHHHRLKLFGVTTLEEFKGLTENDWKEPQDGLIDYTITASEDFD